MREWGGGGVQSACGGARARSGDLWGRGYGRRRGWAGGRQGCVEGRGAGRGARGLETEGICPGRAWFSLRLARGTPATACVCPAAVLSGAACPPPQPALIGGPAFRAAFLTRVASGASPGTSRRVGHPSLSPLHSPGETEHVFQPDSAGQTRTFPV